MRFWALVHKELRLLSRDAHAAGTLFIIPGLFLLIMALAMSSINQNETPRLELKVQASAVEPASDFFLAALQAQLPQSQLETTADQAMAIISLPENFSQNLLDSPHEGPTLSFTAKSDNLSRQHIRSSVTIALAQTRLWAFLIDSELLSDRLPLQEQLRQVHEQTESHIQEFQILASGYTDIQPNASQLSVPAWLVFGMFFIVLPMSNSLQLEFLSGTLLRLRALPLPYSTLLLSKLLPYGIINLLQFCLLLGLGFFALPLLGLPVIKLNGSWLDYLVLASCITSACCSFGLLIAALAKNTEQALLLSAGSNLILAAIGGIMVPKSMMPESMQLAANLSPMSWALDALLNLLIGQGKLADIAHWCAYLLIFALCNATAGIILLHKRVENTSWTSHN